MACGIYCISFSGTDAVYIGQSVDMSRRWKDHIYSFNTDKESHRCKNPKLLNAYNKYGNPNFDILITCLISELDQMEEELIYEFDSVHNGLNILSSNSSFGIRTNTGRSKYSEIEILDIFDMLRDPRVLLISEIAEHLGVTRQLVGEIANGKTHLWLSEAHPKQYAQMLAIKALRPRSLATKLRRMNNPLKAN